MRWSPLKAAVVAFAVVVVLGCIVSVVIASSTGVLHDEPYERGQKIGSGVGTLAVIAGALAYVIQSRRR
jgi:hypothetical protein